MVLGELSRLSRPCSPLDQEKALKEGWLKRQRSIMKNWQLRWFVLRVDALYFYKDQDETKAQVRNPYNLSHKHARLVHDVIRSTAVHFRIAGFFAACCSAADDVVTALAALLVISSALPLTIVLEGLRMQAGSFSGIKRHFPESVPPPLLIPPSAGWQPRTQRVQTALAVARAPHPAPVVWALDAFDTSVFLLPLFNSVPCLIFLKQGCIPLPGGLVNELSASQDEAGRHLFEIVPGELAQ